MTQKIRRRSGPPGWQLITGKLRQHKIYVLVGLGLCMMAAAGLVLARSRQVSGADWRTDAVNAAHQVVRNVVREDLRVSFAGVDETQFEEVAPGKYRLGGWVDLISAQGQIDRQHFSCTMHRSETGAWVGEDVAVIPQ